MVIDLADDVRCVNHFTFTGFIIKTFLVQLFQLFDDTVIIGIFDIDMISLERWWSCKRNWRLFLFLLSVLNRTELRKANFHVREAGIFAHHEIIQVLLISMTLRLVMLNRRNLVRWWLSFFDSNMRCMFFYSVWSLHRVLKVIVVNLFLRKDVSQLIFENLSIIMMTVSILSLKLM